MRGSGPICKLGEFRMEFRMTRTTGIEGVPHGGRESHLQARLVAALQKQDKQGTLAWSCLIDFFASPSLKWIKPQSM
ncbi:hypothetical protein BDA96_01G280600 [Sorghum bicolor]|uniref:Uncharacterized protein n=2 Tax=Sorghum bicolor TaxID=4558 RepID=A0A921S193_SORBI|nr:hypothetical protein BDA96_01G280600 [Sorghum bicolor]OQU91933.1 hypothetical protein SORBI_3001G261577 [Sorghum bicolor]